MAMRVSQVAVMVLRSAAVTSLAPVSASNQFSLHADTAENRDAAGRATTLVLLSYAAGQTRDALISAANSFVIYGSSFQARDIPLEAASSFVLTADASEVREALAPASSGVQLGQAAAGGRDLMADAATALALAASCAASADRPAWAVSALAIDGNTAGESADFMAWSETVVAIGQAVIQGRDAEVAASSSFGLSASAMVTRVLYGVATTSFALGVSGSEVRGAAASATTSLGFRYLGGTGPAPILTVSNFAIGATATAVAEIRLAARTGLVLGPAAGSSRGALVQAVSTMTFGRSAAGKRDVFPAAETTIALACSGAGVRDVPCLASSAMSIDGGQGSSTKDMHPAATTAFSLAGEGLGQRAVYGVAASVVRMGVGIGGVRILLLDATTAIRFHQDAGGINEALGGNPVATHYVGYLGQFAQGQTATLMIRTTGYQGRIVTPDSAPVAKVYGSASNVVRTLRLPAIDKDSGLFAIPLFVGLDLPLGRYRVAYRYTAGGQTWARLDNFEVIPGGDPGGAVISMFAYDRPESAYVLAQLGSGKLVQGRNPRL